MGDFEEQMKKANVGKKKGAVVVQKDIVQLISTENLHNLMVANNIKQLFYLWNSWGEGDEPDLGISGRTEDGVRFPVWNNRPDFMPALENNPAIGEKVLLWGETLEPYWGDEDGGEISLTLYIENGVFNAELCYSTREQQTHNGHYSENEEIDLSSRADFMGFQQVFAYYRKRLAEKSRSKKHLQYQLLWGW